MKLNPLSFTGSIILSLLIFSCREGSPPPETSAKTNSDKFEIYSSGNIELLLPDSLLEKKDIIYASKDSADIAAVRTTVGGQINYNGKTYSYALVETKYFQDSAKYKTLSLDSVKKNLLRNLQGQSAFKLTGMGISKYNGTDIIAYKGWLGNYFIKAVQIPYGAIEYNISYAGADSIEDNLDKIVSSIKFKTKK